MKTRKLTLSFTCCLCIMLCLFVYLDIKIHPLSTNAHLHLYYSYYNNNSDLYNYDNPSRGSTIHFINVLNQSSLKHLKTTTFGYNDNYTRIQPQFPTTTAATTSGSRAHIIAIVSYMRSGSTLTGDILQHFPRSMYVFEPFHSVAVRARRGLPLFYLDGKVKRLKTINITDDFLHAELKKWFDCNFGELDVHSLTDNFHQSYSRSMRAFYRCWRPKPRTLKTLRDCLPIAIQKCKSAKYRLFKFIRLPVKLIHSVMDLYPRLQMIHLIRDPRGSLTSQIKVNNLTWDRIDSMSKEHCERVADDIRFTSRIDTDYPNRAKILQYENLAENPLMTAEKIHNFTGMRHYDYITKYITRLTMAGRRSYGDFGSVRENSTKAAYQWRDKIDYHDLQTIDANCANLYNFLGYQTFSSEQNVRDHTLLTLIPPTSELFL